MSESVWEVAVSRAAAVDIEDIADWSERRFGASQARNYSLLIAEALKALRRGPTVVGAKERGDLGKDLRTLHLGRRGRHVVVFRVTSQSNCKIEVVRILHDAMDIARHLPRGSGDEA